ncbi:MAG: haloacid dehalogenase type II [Arenicellales bacterium]|jgi:2-haloacid dehalogenase|nr:haloacid dehalogenase type II [Arenicellales bacterium]MDP6791022.1 haloacid dehalogenase type II [Arenicellales bacterium]MDP6919030.1 haloacid dehalogenase type II [Arenicellales bacterium]|tara:strand:+ start:120 stop:848 length:729 start_codon:yes stop_codon:yes gene_type:complete
MTKPTSSPASLRAVLFDVFGTVVDWRSSIAREVQAALIHHSVSVDSIAFADRWRALYQPAMSRVRSGEIDFIPLDDLHRQNLDQVLEEFSVDCLSEPEKVDLNLAWHRLDPWPDTVAGLRRLKKGYVVGTLSNGNIALMVNMAKRAQLPWDVILGAEVARAYKPQPQAYLGSAQALGLVPGECMLVAAHNDDLKAAAQCGFKTAFVERPFEHGSDQQSDLVAQGDYDYVARDFVDLAAQLGC